MRRNQSDALALASFLLLAHSADDPFQEWMKSLMRPDYNGPCCGPADQYYPESYWQNDDGSFEAMVGGTDVHVPAAKIILDRVNPTGRGVLFMSAGRTVYCFVLGNGV